MVWWASRSMTILCVDAGAGPPVPILLQTQCAGHAGPGSGGVPWARAAYGDTSRQGPRATAPVSPAEWSPPCTSRRWQRPAACRGDRGPDRHCSRHGTHHPDGKAAPGNATSGSHGQYSGFPTMAPMRNIAGPRSVKYSLQPKGPKSGREELFGQQIRGESRPDFPHRRMHPPDRRPRPGTRRKCIHFHDGE